MKLTASNPPRAKLISGSGCAPDGSTFIKTSPMSPSRLNAGAKTSASSAQLQTPRSRTKEDMYFRTAELCEYTEAITKATGKTLTAKNPAYSGDNGI